MRGTVEVYEVLADGSDKLIHREENMVVDTGHEAIVDMLTTPSSTLEYAPRVMDASNFRIGAMSFGPALSGFQQNAYSLSTTNGRDVPLSIREWYVAISQDKRLRVLTSAPERSDVSSYTPTYQLPSYPDPLDRRLEPLAKTALMDVSALDGVPELVGWGQYENRIQFHPNDTSSYFQGAYPHASGSDFAITSSLEGNYAANSTLGFEASATAISDYNLSGNMDYRGFIRVEPNDDEDTTGRVIFYGSIVSNDPLDFIQDAKVIYETTIVSGDSNYMTMYGGLFQVGLWSLACQESLQNGEAPFDWIPPDVPNPNLLAYTYEGANDYPGPGITFNTDLNGTYYGSDNLGTFSAVAVKNPLGGLSSIELSGAHDSTQDYGAWKALDGASKPAWAAGFEASTTNILSWYVKRPNDDTGTSSFMMKFKDNSGDIENYTNYFEYLHDGVVPTLKEVNPWCTYSIESVGDDWYRVSIRMEGLGDTTETDEGDTLRVHFYMGDSDGSVENMYNKRLWVHGMQFERWPNSESVSATPYQQVAGVYPTSTEKVYSNGITPREFKLFSKKTFTDDLIGRRTQSSPTILAGIKSDVNLKIKWILDFRSSY